MSSYKNELRRIAIEKKQIEQARKLARENAVICKHFGCDKILTLSEQLYGNYCFTHQRNRNVKS